jgi:geranylgeranyl pyrophosphate synthase
MKLYKIIKETNEETERYLNQVCLRARNDLIPILDYCIHAKRDYDRTLISRLFFEAFDRKNRNWKTYIQALCCFDIIDFSILIIDDIIDDTPRRLGRPSTFIAWDLNIAIILSIILKNIAIQNVLSMGDHSKIPPRSLVKIIKSIEETLSSIYWGQFLDKKYENKQINDVTIEEYIDLIRFTTGEHIAHSAEIGAILSDATDAEYILAREIGRDIGIIMQIRDDFIDYIDNEELTGKPPFRDFMTRKKRLPLLLISKYFGKELVGLMNRHKISKNAKSEIMRLVSEKRIISEAKRLIDKVSKDTKAKIKELPNKKIHNYLYELMGVICGSTI